MIVGCVGDVEESVLSGCGIVRILGFFFVVSMVCLKWVEGDLFIVMIV